MLFYVSSYWITGVEGERDYKTFEEMIDTLRKHGFKFIKNDDKDWPYVIEIDNLSKLVYASEVLDTRLSIDGNSISIGYDM